MFKKAEKKKSKLRLAIEGPSGSGKTKGSLIIAKSLGGKIALVDSEHGSASLYADEYDFDAMELSGNYAPEQYIKGIQAAENAGYDVLILDSISHEWEGPGGCLDIHTKLGGQFNDWAKVTPRHNAFIQAILSSKLHVICTMRTKTEYAIELNSKGKNTPRKVGTAPRQRDGFEYEMTCVFNLNQQHMANVSKDRTSLFDGKDFILDESVGKSLIDWLENGVSEPTEEEIDDALDAVKAIPNLNELWSTVPKSLQPKFKGKFKNKKDQIIKDLNKDQAA
jgi:hypothetical protein